jgi:hypothetical protein
VAGEWHRDGPSLPIEFARQSRDGRITLVVTAGARPVPTLWVELAVDSLDGARKALGEREGVTNPYQSIGCWDHRTRSAHQESETIARWAQPRGLDGVVWTALEPKFGGANRIPRCQEVIAYLAGLEGRKREEAEKY